MYSLSSGERRGRSLNLYFTVWGLQGNSVGALLKAVYSFALSNASEGEYVDRRVRRTSLERPAKEGNSPVFKNFFVLLAIFLKYHGERQLLGKQAKLIGQG